MSKNAPIATSAASFGLLRYDWGGLALCALLLGLYAYVWGLGPGATSDSRYYVAAARSWQISGQLLSPEGKPYVFWGPLYPVLLATVGVGQHGLCAVAWLHGACLLGSWVGWSWLGARLLGTGTGRGKQLYWGILALNTPWLVTTKFVWSETGFLLLFTAYVVALYGYLSTKRKGWLLAATLAGLLIPLQRTAGMFLLAGVALGLIVGYGRALRHYGWWLPLHGLVSVSGGAVWQAYVWRTGLDVPLTVVEPSARAAQALSDFSFVLLRWVLPLPTPQGPVSWLYLMGGLALSVGLVIGAAEWGRFGRLLLLATAVYLAGHVLSYMLGRGAAGIYDGERYAAVLYGPVMLMLLAATRRVLRPQLRHLVVLLWLLYPAVRVVHNALFLRSKVKAACVVSHRLPTSPAGLAAQHALFCSSIPNARF